MTKKAKLILKDANNKEIKVIKSKDLAKALNKLSQGSLVNFFIEENDFGEQFVGGYGVKALPNEPEEPEPDHTCPEGQHWDDSQGKCVDDVVNPPSENPVIDVGENANVAGNVNEQVSTSITATDPMKNNDAITDITWSIMQSPDPTLTFTLSPDNWILTFQTAITGEYKFKAVAKGSTGLTSEAVLTVTVREVEQPPEPTGTIDEFGTRLQIPAGYKLSGKNVTMLVGGDPAGNGQRYNVNHRYQNYIMCGYFKTGKDQKQIEMKTDGPNHGSCTSLPNCMWYEPQIMINGDGKLGTEWPHPTNHDVDASKYEHQNIGSIVERWLGYQVCAYDDPAGRTVTEYGNNNPFDNNGKPYNQTWKQAMKMVEKGQIFPAQYIPRTLPINFNKGLEAEIRMHGEHEGHQNPGGTDMKWCKVHELVPV